MGPLGLLPVYFHFEILFFAIKHRDWTVGALKGLGMYLSLIIIAGWLRVNLFIEWEDAGDLGKPSGLT